VDIVQKQRMAAVSYAKRKQAIERKTLDKEAYLGSIARIH